VQDSVVASLLSAAVTDPGAGDSTLTVTGRGATTATESGDTYTVTFNKDVSKCSYTANVTGSSADFSLGVEGGPATNQVRVDQRDAPENTGRPFHLQVIC